jgi:hypothetical protein
MSNPLKVLAVIAAILLGILLYLRTSPARQLMPPESESQSSEVVSEASNASAQDRQAELNLWKTIAPCWSHMADSSMLPVTLRVSFDADGGIASPPEIERKPDAPISLTSESLALQALSACAPYHMVRNQQNVVVTFPAPTRQPKTISDRR